MNRREFMSRCAAMAASSPFFAFLQACEETGGLYDGFEVDFSGSVAVVGAGSAGLAAGYILDRYGIDFQIIEASSVFGGRVKRGDGLWDFPVDLGAEWIHEDPSILAALIDDASTQGAIDVVPYSPDTVYNLLDGDPVRLNGGGNYYSEYKFKDTTWYGFLEQHIAAGILDRIVYDTPIVGVDYSGDGVVLTDQSGGTHAFDRVLLTVPTTVIQRGLISFTPALPADKARALERVDMPDGLKVFIEFSERFYPDIMLVGSLLSGDAYNKIFYDAAFRKGSERHVLALFCVGPDATPYTELGDDQAILDAVLAELDAVFDGQASTSYVQHMVQNWSAEPWIGGAYTFDHGGSDYDATLETLGASLDGKVHFAGEMYSYDNWATVPGAMQSAYAAIEAILKG